MIRKIVIYFQNNQAYGVILLLFIGIVTYTTIREKKETKEIMRSGVFVVGKIVNIRHSRGTTNEYEYEFAERKYHSSEGMHLKYEDSGLRYLVKINPVTPSRSRLLGEYFLADSMSLKQPDSGWKVNPINGN